MTNTFDDRETRERHRAGFAKKQARAQGEKGLLIVHTGDGKGKSTAAWGMVLRCLGHGKRAGIVQFIKGALPSAERDFFQAAELCDFHVAGKGYTWTAENRAENEMAANDGWRRAERLLADGRHAVVVLDELNVVLKYRYLDIDEVLRGLEKRSEKTHVIVTGRHAPRALIDAADLVTEMKSVKHPYRDQGIKAQAGIEF
ncbi:MAG: cob(I)yrinic acid a,c-diamide adenosyltransferase [Candidatus Accumulibacter sp.]|jgi:cob(I)alamin adenosyltransferase|nr:cob(I)yrinic acid a,c-diamide adenosyltransferase [Accumulibacter sp.]